ncbi:armadillo-type protein [Delphinella strobiligena]|nr:armadillo-type protein [Delphinella strobiligena]
MANYRISQFDNRSQANNASQYSRQPAHYPGSAASQRAFDHLNGVPAVSPLNSVVTHNHAAALDQKLRYLAQEQPFVQDSRQLPMMRQSPNNMYSQFCYAQGVPMFNLPMHPGFAQFAMPVMDMASVPRAPHEHIETGQGVRSQLLEDFKQNAKTNKRYDLKDIYEHVVEFSGDQHGSRFIQLKLETANSDEKERIFRELQPNALQLMTDVFGNYVIQKFFEHGDQTQKKILANKMKGQVRQLSLQMYGCRVVQKALDHILNDQQAALIRELKDDVIRCVKDQNGNHVIQKAIERCEAKDIDFIFNAFTNQIHTLSIHTYGCRVIQRCLEHCELPTRQAILRELQDSMPGLIGDGFGNYVVQHVVVHGEEHDKQKVLDLVIKGLEGYSKHKFASNVVEQCLTHAPEAWRKEVLNIIVQGNRREGEGMLIGFIRDNYGNYVIQKLLDVLTYQDYMFFMTVLQPEMAKAKRTGCSKQVMSIEKKMHRFGAPYVSLNPPTPFACRSISAATTPPPLTSDTRSIQTSSVASVNGDTIEGALPSRKGSIQSSEPAVLELSH